MIAKILPAIHVSEETAYLILDYPYGRTLRCQKRVWLETNKKGTRLVSRTSNPKRGNDWGNATKASTYAEISGALYLDENNHVQWESLNQFADAKDARKFLDTFGENSANYKNLVYLTTLKENFEKAKERLGNPEYGTELFKQAYREAIRDTPRI